MEVNPKFFANLKYSDLTRSKRSEALWLSVESINVIERMIVSILRNCLFRKLHCVSEHFRRAYLSSFHATVHTTVKTLYLRGSLIFVN